MFFLLLVRLILLALLAVMLLRWTLCWIERASADLQTMGHPFTIGNWFLLPVLRERHRQERRRKAMQHLESLIRPNDGKENS